MRVGMIPENPIEWILTKLNFIPFPVADTFAAILQARGVLAATRLGVFEALSEKDMTAAELAQSLSCNAKGIQSLLEMLATSGYAVESQGRYRLSSKARKWLDPKKTTSVIKFIDFNLDNWDWLTKLEDSIRTGESIDIHSLESLDKERWGRYMYGLRDLARMGARELVLRFRIQQSEKRLLDIGGGHGVYAAAFLRRYPHLRSTVFDLPAAVEFGREIITKDYPDVLNRVAFQSGDLATDKLGEGYDVVFFFNVIHHIPAENMPATVQKIKLAMKPGGRLVILDQFKQASRRLSYGATLTQLLFLVTSNAGSHYFGDVNRWLADAGFADIKIKDLKMGPGSSMVIASKA